MSIHFDDRRRKALSQRIIKAAVLGSGVMGSGIAAHLANIGIHTLLLDIVPQELAPYEIEKGLTIQNKDVRNRIAKNALKNLLKQKPAPLTNKDNLAFIQVGNMEDDMEKIKDVDWVIEVVVENLNVKKLIFEQVEKYRKKGSIISSNTSGIAVEAMAEGRSEDFQQHFLGTHFFNPPRYLHLLEIVPTKHTNPAIIEFMRTFGEDVLGKGVVIAKDTPNFIANRIGTYGLLITLQEMMKTKMSVGEADSITGPLIGRPKSATFRTLDVVGLDTFIHVANNVYENVEEQERHVFKVPKLMQKMLDNGWLGSKTGQGFYLKKGKEILALNPETLTYEERKKLTAPSLKIAKRQKGTANKMKALLYTDDKVGSFLWNIHTPVLIYAAKLIGEIADDIISIDHAMKWGFGWEMGPFEIWDAIGVEKSVQKMEAEGVEVPIWVKEMLAGGHTSFYKEDLAESYYYHKGSYIERKRNPKEIDLSRLKKQGKIIKKNTGACLIDIGEGVALLEFNSPNNAIGPDILQMIDFAVDEVEANFKGLVIGNQGSNFCVGANIAMILMEAQDDNFFELDFIVRQFQSTMMKIKYAKKPVVAAPFNMTLGGGTEVCLPSAHIQATMETYMGLVEVGVGLIPGGGGNKELYMKHLDNMPNGVEFDLQKVANKVFETIAMAEVSTSGEEARESNFLSFADGISVNRNHQLHDAKQAALTLYESGYRPPVRKKVPVVGEVGYATLLLGAEAMKLSGYISEHDMKIAKKLAFVIAGGKLAYGTEVDEQYLLDLEREAFLSLLAEPKSQQRMQHMLINGKALRN